MEFIEKSFESLRTHLISNGLNVKEENFNFIHSISSFSEKKEFVDICFLGTLINREKTPRYKFYLQDNVYKVANNTFDVYFALYTQKLSTLSIMYQIMVDFENFKDGEKLFLLNGLNELKESPDFVKDFLKRSQKNGLMVVKIGCKVPSLVTPPVLKEVKRVEVISLDSSIKKEKKKVKSTSTLVTYLEKDETQSNKEDHKIVTSTVENYEKRLNKKEKK